MSTLCQHYFRRLKRLKILWSQAPLVNTLSTLQQAPRRIFLTPELALCLAIRPPPVRGHGWREAPCKSHSIVSAAVVRHPQCGQYEAGAGHPAALTDRLLQKRSWNQCERHGHGSPNIRVPVNPSHWGAEFPSLSVVKPPRLPQLHVWPKILCKALVKVGFPPGEALVRSLILRRVDFGGKGSASPTVGPPRHLPRMKISI